MSVDNTALDGAAQRPPEGFAPLFRTSPVIELIGPLYSKGTGQRLQIGFFIGEKHCNNRGTIHGGIVATVADIALGYAATTSQDPPLTALTTSLSIDFLGVACAGEWIWSDVEFQQVGKRIVFSNCYLRVGERNVARASASFSIKP